MAELTENACVPVLSKAMLARILAALIADEKARQSGQRGLEEIPGAGARIDEEGLGFDSLAQLTLVARLNWVFGLSETGIEDYLLVRSTFGEWVDLFAVHFEKLGASAPITFETSGTTGPPARISHGWASLSAEADLHQAYFFPKGAGKGRILALVPAFHIYGFLFTVALPSVAGVEVVDLTRKGPAAAARFARIGDVVVATPSIWAGLVASGVGFQPGVRGVSSGAPLPHSTWSGLTALGLDKLVEVYGSTQTAGLGRRTSPEAPFELLETLRRDGDRIVRNDDPEQRAMPLQDGLDWCDARRFRLGARLDGALQVGGVNVWPDRVARWLEALDGVDAAHVRLDKDRLKAFIVPSVAGGSLDVLEAALTRAVAEGLSPPERPMRFTFGPELPRTALGKLADWTVETLP